EFLELVNVGNAAADLGGWQIFDATSARHTFAGGTTLAAGRAIVVFGGASAIPPGLSNAVAASTGALSLNNSGDTVTVKDATGATIDSFTYTSSLAGTDGVSMNRNPDATATGTFVLHTGISSLSSSPGKRANGQDFASCTTNADCSDGNACNGVENCVSGACVPGTPLSCDDGNACNGVETCNPTTGCVPGTPLSCNDGNVCNGVETCNPTTGCVAGTPPSCDDGNACNGVESCNPTIGCVAGTPPSCDDGNPCTDDSCNAATGCVHTANTATCDDGNACT